MSGPLARWANGIAALVQGLLSCGAWLAGTGLCALAFGDIGKVILLSLLLMALQWLMALIIHEVGHYVAARSAGMTVLIMVIGYLELKPQRRGWRVRWRRQEQRAAGYVVAVNDPARSFRKQMICMIAGGPAANLLAATIAAGLGLAWNSDKAAPVLLAAAVVNAALGLLNLVPSSRGLGSDGLKLLQWRDPRRAFRPDFAHARLLALLVSGVTTDELPEDQLAALEAQPFPLPLVTLWYRLKAQQHRGDWADAAAQQVVFERLEAQLPAEMRRRLVELLAGIRAELAFSCAVLDRNQSFSPAGLELEMADWSLPALRPRCVALRALLDGKTVEAERLLDEARQLAGQSVDRSLARSEAMIRGQMLAALVGRSVDRRAHSAV